MDRLRLVWTARDALVGGLLVAALHLVAAPGSVTDLAAVATTDSTITITWTEVPSGTTTPAAYDVRFGPAAGYAWWLVHFTPPDTVRGTTAAGGPKLQLVVRGLQPSTAYSFQVTAFTGTLGVNAVFSPLLSNVAPGMTAARPPPPPPPAVATMVTINQTIDELVGTRTPLVATVRDQNGAVMVTRVTWTSSAPTVASVDTAGVVLGVAPGIATVTATAGAAHGQTSVVVEAPPPPPPPPPPVATLAPQLLVVPSALSPTQGARVAFYALLRDSTGTVTVGVPATWRSSDTTIVAVDSLTQPVGMRFLAPGSATVTASFAGLTATAAVRVAAVSYGLPVRANFFGRMQTIFPGPQVYTLPDSTGKTVAHAFVTVVVP